MNANELADELEVIFTTYSDEATFEQAATMLRQQQAEIEALKGKQEPVAWLSERLNDGSKRLSFYEPPNTDGNPDYKVEPLYTSPQYRELSDDEINKLYEECYLPIGSNEWEFDPIVFAKAILERAKK